MNTPKSEPRLHTSGIERANVQWCGPTLVLGGEDEKQSKIHYSSSRATVRVRNEGAEGEDESKWVNTRNPNAAPEPFRWSGGVSLSVCALCSLITCSLVKLCLRQKRRGQDRERGECTLEDIFPCVYPRRTSEMIISQKGESHAEAKRARAACLSSSQPDAQGSPKHFGCVHYLPSQPPPPPAAAAAAAAAADGSDGRATSREARPH
ncbi:hypothetical protein F2P81_015390 [Scophthalmus maximus]|uniref:Uncharacterized protein n=1 Tax=Scophthalmus maximus TaxID=52904 RepID=A0A6A4SMG3_SCOMX|nr:hypothetical protein F2P81_015390 [Scophthalmus maximus]